MYPVGQHHGTYIVAENEEGLYLIDQHAAQERIKYEFYKVKIAEVDKEVQELLLPITFEFSNQEALMIEQYEAQLKDVGLFFEPFGQSTYLIRSDRKSTRLNSSHVAISYAVFFLTNKKL